MKLRLLSHPTTPAKWISAFNVKVKRTANGLSLAYNLQGEMRDLRTTYRGAGGAPPERRDELGHATHFEAFVQAEGETDYVAMQFADSRDWAANVFCDYRVYLAPAKALPPRIQRFWGYGHFAVEVDVTGLSDLPVDRPWRVGLSALLEDLGGTKSYWALGHHSDRPDVHHTDGFTALLAPP